MVFSNFLLCAARNVRYGDRMVRTATGLWIAVGLLILAGCKDKAPVPGKIEAKQEVKADPAANLPVAGNLGEQLITEAASRPKDAIKAEAVFEALGKNGIAVNSVKQFMGRTVLANYCSGGLTALVTSVTVCEYATEAAAKAGLEQSAKQFASIRMRTLTQNKLTVLTLVRESDAPEKKAEAEKAIEIFKNL